NVAPFSDSTSISSFRMPGLTTREGQPVVARALSYTVTPGYAETLTLRLREGRFFNEADVTARVRSMLVNETFVRTYLSDSSSVVGMRFPEMFDSEGVEIVGIVADVLPNALDATPEPQIYMPVEPTASIEEIGR